MATTLEQSKDSEDRMQPREGANLLRHLTLQKKFWRDWTPKGKHWSSISEEWKKHLGKRNRPVSVNQLCGAEGSALRWGVVPEDCAPLTRELIEASGKVREKSEAKQAVAGKAALLEFLSAPVPDQINVDFALQSLACVHLLPQIAAKLDVQHWWDVLEILNSQLVHSDLWRVDDEQPADLVLAHQLFAGELRLALAYTFPEIQPLAKLRKAALETLEEGMQELLDGEGMPRANYLGILRALLACWTRCQAMASTVKKDIWGKKCVSNFEHAVTQSLLLSTTIGTPLLAATGRIPWEPDFIAAALARGGDAVDRTAALDLLDKRLAHRISGKSGKTTRESSSDSEWACVAVLRTEFADDAPVIAIDYSRPTLRVEMWQGKQCVLQGEWENETSVDDSRLLPAGSWVQTCWFSDRDVDYLELTLSLGADSRLERQILLARDDLFLIVQDNVVTRDSSRVRHSTGLPLAAGVSFAAEEETRDGYLLGNKTLARVLPLALPEWRVDPRVGELAQRENCLEFTIEREGCRLACPLFLDLMPNRLGKPCTWRQLTVAAALEIQPPEVAVGYRIQCGKEQWLMYRSLAPAANRTVLGQNTSDEFLLARFFAPSGEVEELLQVES